MKQGANRIVGSVRNFDLVARLGGEEFVVMMPEADKALAEKVGERLRWAMEVEAFETGEDVGAIDITCSVGGATLRDGEDAPSLMKRADMALYKAKNAGRNKMVMAE